MKSFVYFVQLLFILCCVPNENELKIYDFKRVQPFLQQKDEKVHVVNFWATWCAPCVKELPYFEKIQEKYIKDVEVILISLDFPSQYENKLIPFLEKRQLKSKVIVLDDVDMNSWIPKVDSNWDGAIPVTLIYNSKNHQFYPQSFTYDELAIEVEKFLN
ncbi:TlpA family protein disulfide reductase [Flavobacteriaceae bacterium]|nr:TlpA family protein disulfide reductase [Flavobacteriaceae bacterium]